MLSWIVIVCSLDAFQGNARFGYDLVMDFYEQRHFSGTPSVPTIKFSVPNLS